MEDKKIITIKKINKSFGGVHALKNIDFNVYENEIRCLVGENGCGKSTLIKVISGFHKFDSGELNIFNKPISNHSPEIAIKMGIQVIYQDFALFPNMTIAENIMMYQTVESKKHLYKQKEKEEIAQSIVKKIDYKIDLKKYVYQLTVAEKQMVAICRALVVNPKLLIMDEPTTALTKPEVVKLFEIVRKLKKQGVSTLFVSHKLDEIYQVCESITIMRNGENVFENVKGDKLPDKDEVVYYMTGRKVDNSRFEYNREDKKLLMEVKDYSLNGCFKNINFKLYEGEILGITGLLGSGRSEFAESLFGVIPADSGSIKLENKEIGIIKSINQAKQNRISYVPDDRLAKGLHLKQSIEDNAVAGIIDDLSSKSGVINKDKENEFKEKSFNDIRIPNLHVKNYASSLSGGNQQKVVLIKWLATKPKILILNCPTVGVDIGAKSEILNLIKKLATEKKIGVILISDDVYEILQVCNRVMIMRSGQITEKMSTKEVTTTMLDNLINKNDAKEKKE